MLGLARRYPPITTRLFKMLCLESLLRLGTARWRKVNWRGGMGARAGRVVVSVLSSDFVLKSGHMLPVSGVQDQVCTAWRVSECVAWWSAPLRACGPGTSSQARVAAVFWPAWGRRVPWRSDSAWFLSWPLCQARGLHAAALRGGLRRCRLAAKSAWALSPCTRGLFPRQRPWGKSG